jgi:hypothetical protein
MSIANTSHVFVEDRLCTDPHDRLLTVGYAKRNKTHLWRCGGILEEDNALDTSRVLRFSRADMKVALARSMIEAQSTRHLQLRF